MKEWEGIIESEVRSFGARVYDWQFRGENLRVFIDRDTGVTIELCAEVSRALTRYFSMYNIEVSSPGVERQLRKPEHFMHYLGNKVQVNTNQGAVMGTLEAVNPDAIRVRVVANQVEEIPFSKINSAFLKVTTEELFRRVNE